MNLFEYLKHINEVVENIKAELPYKLILDCKESLIYIDEEYNVREPVVVSIEDVGTYPAFDFEVNITMNTPLSVADFNLYFDSTLMSYVDVASNGETSVSANGNVLYIYYENSDAIDGTCPSITFTFHANSTGESNIYIGQVNQLLDANGNNLPQEITSTGGEITIGGLQ